MKESHNVSIKIEDTFSEISQLQCQTKCATDDSQRLNLTAIQIVEAVKVYYSVCLSGKLKMRKRIQFKRPEMG
jgi:hypothetical protein